MGSSHNEANNEHPKTPLENLKDILAKADAMAAANLPSAPAVFVTETNSQESSSVKESTDIPSVSKSQIRSILIALQQFPQDMLSRQNTADLLSGLFVLRHSEVSIDNEPNPGEIKIVYPENVRKLDELIKSYHNLLKL